MRTLRLTTLFFLLIGTSAFCQEENKENQKRDKKELSPEEKADKRTEKMTEILGLSEDQAVEIRAINLAHVMEMERIKAEMKQLRKEAKEERERTRANIDSVLNDEQKQRMEEESKKHKEEKERKRKERCCQGDK